MNDASNNNATKASKADLKNCKAIVPSHRGVKTRYNKHVELRKVEKSRQKPRKRESNIFTDSETRTFIN
jgi:hypothetical protein